MSTAIPTMNISLTRELAEFVRAKVGSGLYNSASEVVREALRVFGLYERVRMTTLAKLRADVEEGWKAVDEGRVSDFKPEDIKRRGRQRLANRKGAR